MTTDLTDHSDNELFTKVCSGSHNALYHMLLLYRTSDLRLRGHPFQLPDYKTDLHKNHSLFNLCMSKLIKILVFSVIANLVFFIAFMYSLVSSLCFIVLTCVCCILIKITYL